MMRLFFNAGLQKIVMYVTLLFAPKNLVVIFLFLHRISGYAIVELACEILNTIHIEKFLQYGKLAGVDTIAYLFYFYGSV